MAGNIEDFLRRAIQQKLGKRLEEVEILPAGEVQQPPAAKVHELAQQGVAQHVTDHLNTTEYADRASHLGEEVGEADERLEEHLHTTFDPMLGTLEHEDLDPSSEEKSSESALQGLQQLLRSKSALRNAIILREIIDRPDHRW
ncbi:MAG TPA: hypothetical protein EYN03_07875 [Planctomycetes bacterium]|nr:hypothetical protein [Planctomycetota bacterium]